MTTFSKIWGNEVKPLANACLAEPELMRLITPGEEYQPNGEELEYLKSLYGKYKDVFGMFYISDMIFKVEHALADRRKEAAKLAITQVYAVLNSPSYFQNVFNGDENDEEWKTRKALRDGLYKLLHV